MVTELRLRPFQLRIHLGVQGVTGASSKLSDFNCRSYGNFPLESRALRRKSWLGFAS